jgi:PAS domain S-box-containing protein
VGGQLSQRSATPQTTAPRLHFRVPPEPSHLLRARERIRDYLEQHCSERQVSDDLVMCIEEAATNVIRHSGSDEHFEISLKFAHGDLVAEVRDHGAGFEIARFDPEIVPDVSQDHGRGLFLVSRLCDEMVLRHDGGLVVRMTKKAVASCEPAALESGLAFRAAGNASHRDERLRVMLEEIDEAFIALDWEYRFAHVNEATLRLVGKTRDELLGRRSWDVWPASTDTAAALAIREAMELGRPGVLEFRAVESGDWLEAHVYPTPVGVSLYVREVNARKRKEEAHDRLLARTTLLNRIAAAAAGTLDFTDLAARALEAVRELLGATTGNFFLVDGKAGMLRSLAQFGVPDDALELYRDVPLDSATISGQVALSGEPATNRTPDLADATTRVRQVTGAAESAWMILPVRAGGATLGTLGFAFASDRVFGADEVALYQSVADQLGVGLEKAQLYQAAIEAKAQAGFLADVIEKADMPFGVGAPDGRLLLVNQAFAELTGYSRQELEVMAFSWAVDLTPPEWREPEAAMLAEAIAKRRAVRYEKEYVRKDGSRVPIEVFVQPIFDDDGGLVHYRSFVTDISERKRAEEALRDAEAKSADLVRYAPTGIYEIDFRGPRFRTVNDAMCALSGYGRDELLAMNPFDLLDDDSRTLFAERIRSALGGEPVPDSVEYRFTTKDGRLRDVVLNTRFTETDGVIDGALVVGYDVTDSRRAQTALRESEERFRSLFESTAEGIALHEVIYDAGGRAVDYRIIDVNPSFESQTGVLANDARGRLASELYGTGDPPYLAEYARVAAGEGPSCFETYFAPMDRHFHITVTSPARGRFATVFEDITERKQTDEERGHLAREAAAERERLQTVLEAMTEGLVISDADTSVIHMNAEALRLHGFDNVEQVRRGLAEWPELEPHTLDGKPLALEDSALARVTRGETFKGLEYEVRNKTTGTAWIGSFGGAPIRDEDGKVVLTVLTIRDVTERKRAEEELRLHNAELAERVHLADSLNAINRMLHATLDFGTIMQGALDEGVEALGVSAGAIEMREGSHWVIRHQHGLAETDVGLRLGADEAPIATRVAERGEPLVIADLHAGVVVDIGLAHDHALRSLLAIPLVAPGVVIGCLLLCGKGVHSFSDAEVDFGRKLGATVSMALENARLYEDQQRIATTLQENFVHELPDVAGLELGVVSKTAHEPELVGGDFSDVFVIDDTHVVALIGDVAGKGVRAAGMTETVRSTVRALAAVDPSPAFILAKTNELLLRFDPDESHVTAFLAVLDPRTGHLSYASAGHPAPVHLGAFSSRPLGVAYGPPLGSFERPYDGGHAMLTRNDYLVLYTDGVTEARRDGELLGEQRLLEVVSGLRGRSAQEIADGVRDAAIGFADRLRDDLQVVVLRLA